MKKVILGTGLICSGVMISCTSLITNIFELLALAFFFLLFGVGLIINGFDLLTKKYHDIPEVDEIEK